MAFSVAPLPYDYAALEPTIDAATMKLHHDKHHQTYVDNLNKAVEGDASLQGKSLEELVASAGAASKVVRNNGGGHWNHSFFWQCLAPAQGQQPSGKLAKLIEDGFGNSESMLQKLQEEAVNHFASGWAWLVLDRGTLRITSLHDADTPAVHDGMVPLFTLDVWEHAYYIDYRNERPRFLKSVLENIINWDFVAENLDGNGIGRADQEGATTREETEPANA